MRTATTKSIASKRHVTHRVSPAVIANIDPPAPDCEREDWIAQAAYFKAEARGFVPGLEMEDWLEAEAEYTGASEVQ